MMTKMRWLLILGVLIFAVGILTGQQLQRSKFDKYLGTTGATLMDVVELRANMDIVRSFMPFEVPRIQFESACACFHAYSTITSESMKEPLDKVRTKMLAAAALARDKVAAILPEMSKSGTAPDRDFKMTFYELNLDNPARSGNIAEYVDGKLIFK